MKYFIGLMLLFTQVALAADTANPEPKNSLSQINELQKELAELQKEVDELKLVKVTCICEVDDGFTRAGGYIKGKGDNVFTAEDNAREACKTQTRENKGMTSVFNCLDKRLDNVRHHIFPIEAPIMKNSSSG